MNAHTALDPVKHFKSVAWTSTDRAQVYDRTTNSTSDLTHFLTTEFIGLLRKAHRAEERRARSRLRHRRADQRRWPSSATTSPAWTSMSHARQDRHRHRPRPHHAAPGRRLRALPLADRERRRRHHAG